MVRPETDHFRMRPYCRAVVQPPRGASGCPPGSGCRCRAKTAVSIFPTGSNTATMPVLTMTRLLFCLFIVAIPCVCLAETPAKTFRAGTSIVDITPTKLPITVVGNFFPGPVGKVSDPLHARCLVLDNGTERIALVVLDLLGIPVPAADEAKRLIEMETNIPRDRVMISATHTHSGPGVPAHPQTEIIPQNCSPKSSKVLFVRCKISLPPRLAGQSETIRITFIAVDF